MPKIKVNIIGAGRVGQTLLGLFNVRPECSIQDVLSNRYTSAQKAVQLAGTGRAVEKYEDLRPADLWVLTVPDSQISIVATKISEVFKEHEAEGQTPVAFHCSGFFPADQMGPLRGLRWHLASVHPVLTFVDPVTAMQQFMGTYCGIEGDKLALGIIQPLLKKMGAHLFQIETESKSLYHAAAVISNNFSVVLQVIAREAWAVAGVPDDIAQELNNTLLKATYENVAAKGPWEALTGPASRGDNLVVVQQGNDVARWHPAAGVLYKEMSLLAQKIKAQGKTINILDAHGKELK